ncbi:hypothetical protein [Acinetobacter nematophilus]|uniref:Uncharacterized protein n=1 Tax=Acinetobacter nematophilus TaxID=2994642 RepID=A0A9X3IF99_9GAMM|nr:hypothetical protein [Acinetobacter nematophilus]MCX5466568.1 hypothetical protein [Acinetobacter nematophilus]
MRKSIRNFFKIISLNFFISGVAYAGFCDDSNVITKILKQAKIAKVEQSLLDCKLDPVDDSRMIMAYASWLSVKGHPEEGDYALDLIQFNPHNLKVVDHYRVADRLVSDAISLDSITLDTANYKVTELNRALGLRLNYSGHSQPNPFSMQLLNLYDLKSKKQILDSLVVTRDRAETDMHCNADAEERASTLVMQRSQTKKYTDILVNSKIKRYQTQVISEECQEVNQQFSQQRFTLKFDGNQYQIPKNFKDEYQY